MDGAGVSARLAGLADATIPTTDASPLIAAAVLVPIVLDPWRADWRARHGSPSLLEPAIHASGQSTSGDRGLAHAPAILLTKRNASLTRHAGQICFPGGRIEASDSSPAAAALREAAEELAIDPGTVVLLGCLPDHATGTGFRITPVVGLVPAGLDLQPAKDEVEAVFELPLATLLDPAAPVRMRAWREGGFRDSWVWPHPEHEIWGATATILMRLAELLRRPV